jgi:hypothetical protein
MEIGLALGFAVVFLAVYWGATVLLEATGLERRKARFQALSAIVGCGFTTGESESIVNHPRRRSIIFWLMVLGNSAVLGLIVAVVTGVGARERPFWLFFVVLGGFIAALIIASRLGLFRWVNNAVVSVVTRAFVRDLHRPHEVLHQADAYGVVLVTVSRDAVAAGLTVGNCGLSAIGGIVLAVERKGAVLSLPAAEVKLEADDRVLCYGNMAKISGLDWRGVPPTK